ncbi:Deoxyguanosinetriphosphate triphosphohydrolase-like protein, partial [Geodia barretti]
PVPIRCQVRKNQGTLDTRRAFAAQDRIPARPGPHHHSNGFRRLKHKTQVFIAPTGDHYVTRSDPYPGGDPDSAHHRKGPQPQRRPGGGHRPGPRPGAHAISATWGEEELDRLHPEGFHHSAQSLRMVEYLGRNGRGLNLTWEVREGIESHSKPREDLMGALKGEDVSLEAQICRISDAVAYLNHDIGDAIRAGVISEDNLPRDCKEVLGTRHSQRIDTMVSDIVRSSWSIADGKRPSDGGSPPSP